MNEFYEDKTITCRDCKQPFVFTGGEQRFFAERQFTEPNRCKPCRAAKKAAREAQGGNGTPIQGYGAPPPQLDSASPRRPFVYEPAQDAQRQGGAGAGGGPGKKRSGGGKRRRDEEGGWGGGYDD